MIAARVLFVALTGWLLLVAGAGVASAHAALDSTDPAQGSVLATAPARVTLTFSETVQVAGNGVRVLAPDGTQADAGQAGSAGNAVFVGLRGGLPEGTYTVSWRVVSADSHPVSGAFTFSIGHASAARAEASAPPGDSTVSVLYAIARAVAFAAFAVLVGSAAFVLSCLPGAMISRAVRIVVFTGWAGSVAGCLGSLLLQGPYGFGLGLGAAFDVPVLKEVMAGRIGGALQARLFLLFLCGVYVVWLCSAPGRRGHRWALGVAGSVLAVALALTWSVGGHAAVGLQPAVAVPVDVLHLIAMAVWLGGLTTLLVVIFRRVVPEADLMGAARRFSTIAAASVAVLVATGSYQAWRQLGTWSAWLSTGYGRLLLVKVVVVAFVVVAAAFSRRWVRQRGEAGPRAFRWSVLAEAGLGVVVLSVTALLVESEPGRTATAAPPGPVHREVAYDTGGPGGSGRVEVDIDPAAGGPNTVRIVVEDSAGRPRQVPELHARLTRPDRGLGPLEIPLRPTGFGYEALGEQIPASGSWQLALTVRTSDLDETVVATTIDIR
ncbi:copper resistance protein CopC [Amycolatopsis acidicola]|uniref:Copper resistance protein CopC n=1 Tax=Amycolatopsis acidicola TaxID=2596893 RepID=A0A5N0UVK3_9PSEU|nr:copper resistance protein CopC [Amycolatopsis acidicola]KAA9154666.1 copper resistance protein CopC [Amycolatopsis acidicola]